MASVHIFCGSVMGTALDVARNADAILIGQGHTTILHETFDASKLTKDSVWLICTSTTGMGDLPESIVPFYMYVETQNPHLHKRQYGVISLGDSSYPNFADAGERLDALMQDRGATRIGEICVLDAIMVDDHEEDSTDWISDFGHKISAIEGERNA